MVKGRTGLSRAVLPLLKVLGGEVPGCHGAAVCSHICVSCLLQGEGCHPVTSRGPWRNTTCMNLGKWQAGTALVQRGVVASCWGGRARGAESLALLLLLLMSVNFIFFFSLSTYFFVLLSF